jgi:hypothetical protein
VRYPRSFRRGTEASTGCPYNEDTLSSYAIALIAARNIKTLHPAFYHRHIARCLTTPRALLGVVQAFFSLASQTIALDLPPEFVIHENDPLQALQSSYAGDDDEAISIVSQFAGAHVHEIWPWVYGLEHEIYEIDQSYGLAIAIWYITAGSTWTYHVDAAELREQYLSEFAGQKELCSIFATLPQVPSGTPLQFLCARLDREDQHLKCNLGTSIRYVFSSTGNELADHCWSEVAQMETSGLEWNAETMAEVARLQHQAAEWSDRYHNLNRRIHAEPAVLEYLAVTVVTEAQAIQDSTTTREKAGGRPPTAMTTMEEAHDNIN